MAMSKVDAAPQTAALVPTTSALAPTTSAQGSTVAKDVVSPGELCGFVRPPGVLQVASVGITLIGLGVIGGYVVGAVGGTVRRDERAGLVCPSLSPSHWAVLMDVGYGVGISISSDNTG